MDEEYYLTEEQRIRLEIEKEEKKKLKKEAGRRWRWLRGAAIAGLILLVVIFFLIRQWEKSQDVHRKPVIYLYPEETAEVFVRLELDGELTTTYPKYQNGWHVTAEPDGTLTDAVIRVYMAWYGSDKPVKLQNQELSSMERKGFTVVEWGGSEIHSR